ncbi:MAG: PAS domain-containing protein [Gammaproteobacteria bacterium]
MQISSSTLQILIDATSRPAAIFDLELNLLVCNLAFKQNYEFITESKLLKVGDTSPSLDISQMELIDLRQLFAEREEQTEIFITKYLRVDIKPLQNEQLQIWGWYLIFKQSFVTCENMYLSFHDSESRFKLLADYMPQIVWITNVEGSLEYCNKRWEDYTGLKFEQILAGEWTSIIHPDDLQTALDAWEKAFVTKDIYEAEARFKRASDATYRWHLMRGFPIKNEQGDIVVWFGTSTDIEDVKKAEENLRESERQYNTLIKSLHSVYWTAAPWGGVDSPQPSWEKFSGQTWEQYKDFGWVATVHPEDRAELLEAWQQALESVTLYQAVARFWSVQANDYIYCIARAAPFIDENGKLLKWIGSCLDINLQKQSERALKEVSEHLTLALDSANAGIWSWDIIDNKITWSERTYALFGLKTDYALESYADYINHVYPADRELIESELKKVLEGNKLEFECEYRVIWPDNTIRLIFSRGKLHINEAEKVNKMIGICFDITEGKQLEKQIHQNHLDFANEAKVSSIAEIASTLAHELNQPLAVIATFTQGCVAQIEKGNFVVGDLLYALKEASTQSVRAGEIIHRIKNSVNKKSLYMEPTNLRELVSESLHFMRYGKDSDLTYIRYQNFDTVPTIVIDKVQIQQVIINLLRNSMEALDGFSIVNPEIVISCMLISKKLLAVQIFDNGPGFSPEILSGTETYVSSKEGGMGMGLNICRSIIQAHGGQLTLTQTPTGGASVQFTLPIITDY